MHEHLHLGSPIQVTQPPARAREVTKILRTAQPASIHQGQAIASVRGFYWPTPQLNDQELIGQQMLNGPLAEVLRCIQLTMIRGGFHWGDGQQLGSW